MIVSPYCTIGPYFPASFVEEFYAFLLPLTELGFTVIGFDGPGQGGALRQGIYFERCRSSSARVQ